jgi:WD40 repeat protein
VAFSPDGTRIVSGSADDTLKVWDAQTGQETLTLTGHGDFVTSVAFSPDGTRIVSGSVDKKLKVWDAQTGQEILTLTEHNNWVNCVMFSPDGTWIVSGSSDGTIKVWDGSMKQEEPSGKHELVSRHSPSHERQMAALHQPGDHAATACEFFHEFPNAVLGIRPSPTVGTAIHRI